MQGEAAPPALGHCFCVPKGVFGRALAAADALDHTNPRADTRLWPGFVDVGPTLLLSLPLPQINFLEAKTALAIFQSKGRRKPAPCEAGEAAEAGGEAGEASCESGRA